MRTRWLARDHLPPRAKRLIARVATPSLRVWNRIVLSLRYGRGPVQAALPPVADPVLFVFPHVDDETIAAGGALLSARAAGARVDLVYTTDSSAGGAAPTPTARAAARLQEAHTLAHRVGIRSVRVLSGINEGLTDHASAVERELIAVLEAEEYQTVFVVSPVDAHHEHRASARIIADALVHVGFVGPVYVGENSNLLPQGLLTHALGMSREHLAERQSLLALFRSQTTMGFEVYRDLARSRRALSPGAHAVELFHRTDAAGYARLVDAVEGLDPRLVFPHRIGNSWSLHRAIRPLAAHHEAVLIDAAEHPDRV